MQAGALGLPLGLETPSMTPNGVICFLEFSFLFKQGMLGVQVALHPINTEAGPSLGRLNSMHRRRKSGSGSRALMEGSRADVEAAGAAVAAEASPQASRSFMHRYDYCTVLLCLWYYCYYYSCAPRHQGMGTLS